MYIGQDFISTVIAVLLFSYTTICKGVPFEKVMLWKTNCVMQNFIMKYWKDIITQNMFFVNMSLANCKIKILIFFEYSAHWTLCLKWIYTRQSQKKPWKEMIRQEDRWTFYWTPGWVLAMFCNTWKSVCLKYKFFVSTRNVDISTIGR